MSSRTVNDGLSNSTINDIREQKCQWQKKRYGRVQNSKNGKRNIKKRLRPQSRRKMQIDEIGLGLPITSGANGNLTNATASAGTPPNNTTAATQPTNASIPTTPSGGKGSGSTCAAGNCTSGTPLPVDCTKNPTNPSCTQMLTPSTTVPTTTAPTTKTCPDGSVIDASATCPTQPGSPSPSNPNTQTPPPNENNPPPGDNGNNNPTNRANDKSNDVTMLFIYCRQSINSMVYF
jgi:hypothetical protein